MEKEVISNGGLGNGRASAPGCWSGNTPEAAKVRVPRWPATFDGHHSSSACRGPSAPCSCSWPCGSCCASSCASPGLPERPGPSARTPPDGREPGDGCIERPDQGGRTNGPDVVDADYEEVN